MLQHGVHLKAIEPGPAAILPPQYHRALWMEGASCIEGFSLAANLTAAIVCAPGSTPLISRCSFRPATEVGWDYPSMRSAVVAWGQAFPRVSQCVIAGFEQGVWAGGVIEECTLVDNKTAVLGPDEGPPPVIRNSIIRNTLGNGTSWLVNVPPSNIAYSLVSDPALDGLNGNIFADPQFVNPDKGDFRLSPTSPCIDAGDNTSPYIPDTDLPGMHRIMYGGKSLTVDMGAYEYYLNELEPGPAVDETTLTWSSLSDTSYSIFYSDVLLTWHLADPNLPSAGNMTTSWTDDGSKTGIPPSLAPRRFYRILGNP